MYPVIFDFSGHPLISWTVFVLVGCWAAYFSIRTDLTLRKVPNWQIHFLFLGCIISWFLGAHLGQIITVGPATPDPTGRFQFAGYVLYGGILGVFVWGISAWWFLKWRKYLLFQELWDCGSLALAWALVFGRIGCTLYGCCYGSESGNWPGIELNEARWDLQNRAFPEALRGVPLHPATFYEAFGIFLIIFVLYRIRELGPKLSKHFPPGVPGWICWISYSVIRFFVEFIRLDPRGDSYFGLSPSQCMALVIVGLGMIILPWEKAQARVPIFLSKR